MFNTSRIPGVETGKRRARLHRALSPLYPVTLVMFVATAFGNPDYYTRSHPHSPVLLLALICRNVQICLGDTLCHNILKAFKFRLKKILLHQGFAGVFEIVSHWFLDSAHVSFPGSLAYQTNPHHSHFIQSPGHVGVCLLRLSLGF